ncbi:MAG: dihydrofolate reductase [Nocardioidaceae bacterium]|nr:dihydrofolate reductase [Nocardioidaceae bacterium]
MTKTQYYTATSIDGFIADEDNSLDWLFAASSTDKEDDRFATFFAGVGAMAMGATTYEWVLEHDQLLEHPTKWQDYYGDTPCWVFTHRALPPIPGAALTFVRGAVGPVHDKMVRASGDKNVWIIGGGDLVGQFLDQELLDEIHLGMAPVMLGAGAPLLPRRLEASDLTLLGVEHDRGFVFLTYAVALGEKHESDGR